MVGPLLSMGGSESSRISSKIPKMNEGLTGLNDMRVNN